MITDSDVAGTAPPRPNPFKRIGGIFFSPLETMTDIARRPDWVVALVLLTLLGVALNLYAAPKIDFESEMRVDLEERGLTEEQIDRQMEMVTNVQKFSGVMGAAFILLAIAGIAGILLIAFKMFGGEGRYVQALAVTTYGSYPLLLVKNVLTTALIVPRSTITPSEMVALVKSNPGFLVDAKEAPMAFAFLSSIDVFSIWALFLLTLGFAEASRLSRRQSAILIGSLWGAMVLVKVGFAALT